MYYQAAYLSFGILIGVASTFTYFKSCSKHCENNTNSSKFFKDETSEPKNFAKQDDEPYRGHYDMGQRSTKQNSEYSQYYNKDR